MDRNEKIAFGVGIVAFLYLRRRQNKVLSLVMRQNAVTEQVLDVLYQKEVDEKFVDIVEHYDE
jgi:hypothetical protein